LVLFWDFLYLSFLRYLASASSTETSAAKTKDQLRMSPGIRRILEQQESSASIPTEAEGGRMLNTASACPNAVFVAFHHDKDAGKKFAEGKGYSRRKDYHREASMQSYFLLLILFRTRNRCKISLSPDTCVFANQTALRCDTPS
jgi:hypothetical protein